MKEAQKLDHVGLNTLIGRLRGGRCVHSRLPARVESEPPGGIHRSRMVDSVTRGGCEAALLWFRDVPVQGE